MNALDSQSISSAALARHQAINFLLCAALVLSSCGESQKQEEREVNATHVNRQPAIRPIRQNYSLSTSSDVLGKAIISGGDSSAAVGRLLMDIRQAPDWENQIRGFCVGPDAKIPWEQICTTNRKKAWQFLMSLGDDPLRVIMYEKFRDTLTPAEFHSWVAEMRMSKSEGLQARFSTGIELAAIATPAELLELTYDPTVWVWQGATKALAARVGEKMDWLDQAQQIAPDLSDTARKLFVDQVVYTAGRERPGDWPLSGPGIDQICSFVRSGLENDQATALLGKYLALFATDHPVEALQQVLDTQFPDQLLAARAMFTSWVAKDAGGAMEYLNLVPHSPAKDQLILGALSVGHMDSSPATLNHWINQMYDKTIAAGVKEQLGLSQK